MQIKVLKPTVADGKNINPGDVAEVSDQAGRFLINIGKAEAYTAPPKPKAKAKESPTNRMVSTDDLDAR